MWKARKKGNRVHFGVRLACNILNHVLVLLGINYTFGFPLELAREVLLTNPAKLNSSGLTKYGWFLASLILDSKLKDLYKSEGITTLWDTPKLF